MPQLMRFTFCHDHEQDRIRMLAEGDEGDRCAYWLTRRLTANLLSNAESWLTECYAARLNVPAPAQSEVYELYHDKARGRFEQNQAMGAEAAVADVAETRLLTQVDIMLRDDGQLKLTFFAGPEADSWSAMSVNYFHQLLHILQLKTELMEWGLSATQPRPQYALQ